MALSSQQNLPTSVTCSVADDGSLRGLNQDQLTECKRPQPGTELCAGLRISNRPDLTAEASDSHEESGLRVMISMPMLSLFSDLPLHVLSEAAICERLRGNDAITLHPTLFNTPLIYDESAAKLLASITHQYIDIAREFAVPIIIAAPTWRLDAQRVAGADVPASINRDAVDFIQKIKQDAGYEPVYVTGLLAPKNDCYDPNAALSVGEAESFHATQAEQLAEAGLDLLTAQTVPAVSEAEGMARAMIASWAACGDWPLYHPRGEGVRRHSAWMRRSTCSMSVWTVRTLRLRGELLASGFYQGGADEPTRLVTADRHLGQCLSQRAQRAGAKRGDGCR